MVIDCPIPGITIHQTPEAVHVHCQKTLTTLSSSFFGGGFQRVRDIVNANVAVDYCSDTPAVELRAIAARMGVSGDFVGLLTAVAMRNVRAAFFRDGDVQVGALVTAGVGNATSAGITLPFSATPGTINIVVLLDAKLTHAALTNAIITVTEAKTAVLNEMGVSAPGGDIATGTSTDTVTIAATGQGRLERYAGPATMVGWMAAKCVREAMRESLQAGELAAVGHGQRQLCWV